MDKLARGVGDLVAAQNGYGLSAHLSVRNEAYALPAAGEFFGQGDEKAASSRMDRMLQNSLPPGSSHIWGVVAQNQIRAVACLSTNRWKDAARHVSDSLFEFNKFMSNEATASRSSWWLPVLWLLCRESRILSRQADLEMETHGLDPTTMSSLQPKVLSSFNTCNNDKRGAQNDSLRRGALEVANQLFRIYFRLNTVKLCHNIIRSLNSKAEIVSAPRAHVVTYKYFFGRIMFIDHKYDAAEQALMFAWRQTPQRFVSQRRKILEYLVPTGLVQRRMVAEPILLHYKLPLYRDFRDACVNGNVTLHRRLMEQHMLYLVRRGLYVALEELRLYPVMSALLRQLHKFHAELSAEIPNSKPEHLSLNELLYVLKALGEDMELTDLEGMLCTMIYRGFIKGYVSHKYHKLVVAASSTAKPFPRLEPPETQ